ncbi:MAG: hypothetical protein WCG80_15385 [Spirochaetales bacterium]
MRPAVLRSLAGLILAGLLGAGSAAQQKDITITETVLVPPVFSVGDPVEMRVTLVLPEGVELRPIQTLPTQSWLVFQDVKIRPDPPFQHVTIKFVSFAPGEKLLPALELGDVKLDSLQITTASVLAKESSATAAGLSPPRDQLPLPHTEIILLTLFLILVVLPVLIWRFLQPALALLALLWKHLDRHRPYHRLLRESRKLQAKVSGTSGPEFYTQFLLLARAYLSGRFDRDFSSYTATEFASVLGSASPTAALNWTRMLHKADVVRFDSRNPDDVERLDDLELLRNEARLLEGREGPHVDV